MSANPRCELCGYYHHFANTAGGCRAFGVHTYAEREIARLKGDERSAWEKICDSNNPVLLYHRRP